MKPNQNKLEPEIRYLSAPLSVDDAKDPKESGEVTASGYAAVFDSRSHDLGGFVEVIAPGAFARVLSEGATDVRCYLNHDHNAILGRQSARTLELSEDSRGLKYSVRMPDTTYARDLAVSMKRGDVRDSSFAFTCDPQTGEEWTELEGGIFLRTIKEVRRLFDVSVVALGAYQEADSQVATRNLTNWRASRSALPPRLARAQRQVELLRLGAQK